MIKAGTVSHGTLREEDLIPKFAAILEDEDSERYNYWRAEFPNCANLAFYMTTYDERSYALEQLFEDLDILAHNVGMYFGASEGDGADFGFWPYYE